MPTITHKGKTITTKWEYKATQEELNEVRQGWYSTNHEQAVAQIEKALAGGLKQDKIYKYYFERIANDTVVQGAKWSINEMLESDELLSMFIEKSRSNTKVFTSDDLTTNVRTAVSLGGKGYARGVTQFPLKENVRLIKGKNGLIVDMVCGWGTRMLSAAITDNNYVGFEVNEPLIEKLNELGNDIKKFKPDFVFSIRSQDSAIFEPRLFDKCDQIITSPPYFDVEVYEQRTDTVYAGTYADFYAQFLKPMIDNAINYTKTGGQVMVNIKDYPDKPMMSDIVNEWGNLNTEKEHLANIGRTLSSGKFHDGDEDILVINV